MSIRVTIKSKEEIEKTLNHAGCCKRSGLLFSPLMFNECGKTGTICGYHGNRPKCFTLNGVSWIWSIDWLNVEDNRESVAFIYALLLKKARLI